MLLTDDVVKALIKVNILINNLTFERFINLSKEKIIFIDDFYENLSNFFIICKLHRDVCISQQ